MISPERRIELLVELGKYISSNDEKWAEQKERAVLANPWFIKEHVTEATDNIARNFLVKDELIEWVSKYSLPVHSKKVGFVMAGNIPLVGFHDFLCGFIAGHDLYLKLSSKDEVLLKHLIEKLVEWEPSISGSIHVADNLKNCDAYIATGSNNTARYFEQYFGKYPHIIRRNRTSVAMLEGNETEEELKALAKDVFSYYGLGCRNVTQVCVPDTYNFEHLLDAFMEYDDYALHHKYKNNYDYHLTLYLLNRIPYQTNGSVLLVENNLPFSAVSVLHYRYYQNKKDILEELQQSNDIQTVVGKGFTPFGASQSPSLSEYADRVDTMEFLCKL